jgi:ubiquinone/menaquinone biosynthesis C-methylase UbiE
MDDHVLDAERAETLEDDRRYRILSREELLADVESDDTVVDIGSGTGFFTDDIAARAAKVYAVDFQEAMHEYYREKGLPDPVETVHSTAAAVAVEDADLVVSILSFHEIDLGRALRTFSEVLGDDGRLFVVDWSANAATDVAPPREKLYSAADASKKVAELFDVIESEERFDTFKLTAAV